MERDDVRTDITHVGDPDRNTLARDVAVRAELPTPKMPAYEPALANLVAGSLETGAILAPAPPRQRRARERRAARTPAWAVVAAAALGTLAVVVATTLVA